MGGKAHGFAFRTDTGGEVRVTHHGRLAAVLRNETARRFLQDVEAGDPQQVMARVTGNYKRGNERIAKRHPRNTA